MIEQILGHPDASLSFTQRRRNKKDKIGRWTSAESYLFQSLLQRYGKNWQKIHEHMKVRTLAQIRSHAQKYFEKVGPKKVQGFERRAKLLDAYETLKNEKRLLETSQSSSQKEIISQEVLVKIQEQSPLTQFSGNQILPNQSKCSSLTQNQKLIKEQIESQAPQHLQYNGLVQSYSSMKMPYINGGYLMNIIYSDLAGFQKFGIQNFIDDPNFRKIHQTYRQ